jgi:hypothetical protein
VEARGRGWWVNTSKRDKAKRGSACRARVTPTRMGTDLRGAQTPGVAAFGGDVDGLELRLEDAAPRSLEKRQEGHSVRKSRGYPEGKTSESKNPWALPA